MSNETRLYNVLVDEYRSLEKELRSMQKLNPTGHGVELWLNRMNQIQRVLVKAGYERLDESEGK